MSLARTTDSTRRFPGRVLSSSSPAAALSRRDRLLIPACIALITLLAWAYLVHLDRQMSVDMEHDKMMAAMGMTMDMPWSAADVFFTFAMWAVMMVGMMAPSASPMLMLFAAARAGRGKRGVSLATLVFGLGYSAAWTGFSVGAALAQSGLHHAAMLSAAMASSSGRLAGAILIAAGVYQLTPWKSRCLRHCRSPLGFLMSNWRDGTTGAFQMGFRHGAYCLGCCWALMCVLFAVGVMNLIWVATLTGFVLIEKIGPAGAVVARVAGAAMVVVGIVVIA
jgi:predicted metal-binding membrane protein